MSRKDWDEGMRHEEVCKLGDKIDFLTMKQNHLQSQDWQKPYPKDTGMGYYEYPNGETV